MIDEKRSLITWPVVLLTVCCVATAQTVNSPSAVEKYVRYGVLLRSTTQPGYSEFLDTLRYVQSTPEDTATVLAKLATDRELPQQRRITAVTLLVSTRSPEAEPVLLGLLEDNDPVIQAMAMGALAASQSRSPIFFETLRRRARQTDEVGPQTAAVLALLALKDRPEAMGVVEEVYRSPDVNDLVKLQIARTRAMRHHDFDRSIARDILYRQLADPQASLSRQCNLVADLALLEDFSQTYRLANALESDKSRRLALMVLPRVLPSGPTCRVSTTETSSDEMISCVHQWKDFLWANHGIRSTPPPSTMPE